MHRTHRHRTAVFGQRAFLFLFVSLFALLGAALDGSGYAYVTGNTKAPDFPVTAAGSNDSHNGNYDVFLTELQFQWGSVRVSITGPSEARWSLDGAGSHASEETVEYVPVGDHVVSFSDVAGWSTPSDQSVAVEENLTTETSGTYLRHEEGSIRVSITGPSEARWSLDGAGSHASGETVEYVPVGDHVVSFSDVAGWSTPSDQSVAVEENLTTETSGTYLRHEEGSIRVSITGPSEARWSLDGVGSRASGETVEHVPVGDHIVSFSDVAGWSTPSDQSVAVEENLTTETSGTYLRHEEGSIRVSITGPSEARWYLDDAGGYASGVSVPCVRIGSHYISFSKVEGWDSPECRIVIVLGDIMTELSATYTRTLTPVLLQPLDRLIIPPEFPLPEGSHSSITTPLKVTLPPNPTSIQKKEALREALRKAFVPEELVEEIADLLTVDDTGLLFILGDGMDRLRELLDEIEIPEGAEGSPLAVFRTVLDAQDGALTASDGAATMIVFFETRERFVGIRSDRLQVVKMFSGESAGVFERVYALEDLRDGCAAVVEAEDVGGVATLTRVIEAADTISGKCFLALAIKDGGRFDLDGLENGGVTDPAFLVEGVKEIDPDGPGGGSESYGCASGGSSSFALLMLLAPLALLDGGRKRR